jgi:DNA-3-methyladenine glycosylase I
MFEALTLGVLELGLSWSVVFSKRDAFRTAFRGFDVAKVPAMTERDVDRLTENASIIRNRRKIQAIVDNARAAMFESPDLVTLAKSYEITRRRAPRSVADLPTTPQAEAFARQLKSQGFRFVGPTTMYAFMQNVDMVNDHVQMLPRDRLPRRGGRESVKPALRQAKSNNGGCTSMVPVPDQAVSVRAAQVVGDRRSTRLYYRS